MASDPLSILLIEDDAEYADTVSERFRLEGFRVHVVSSSNEIKDALLECNEDMVLCDVHLSVHPRSMISWFQKGCKAGFKPFLFLTAEPKSELSLELTEREHYPVLSKMEVNGRLTDLIYNYLQIFKITGKGMDEFAAEQFLNYIKLFNSSRSGKNEIEAGYIHHQMKNEYQALLLLSETMTNMHYHEGGEVVNNSVAFGIVENETFEVVSCNREFALLSEEKELKGRPINEVFPLFEKQGLIELMQKVYTTGQPLHIKEIFVMFHDGMRTLSFICRPVPVKGLKKKGRLLVQFTDHSRQTELESLLANANREKQVLVSEIHHRVHNNLAFINSMISLELMESGAKESALPLQKLQSRIKTISDIHRLIYSNDDFYHIEIKNFIENLELEFCDPEKSSSKISIRQAGSICLNVNQAIPFALILNEILMHSRELSLDLEVVLKKEKEMIQADCFGDLAQYYNRGFTTGSSLRYSILESQLMQLSGLFKRTGERSFSFYFKVKPAQKGSHANHFTESDQAIF